MKYYIKSATSYDDVDAMEEAIIDYLGYEEAFEALIRALSYDEKKENYEYIIQCYDIPFGDDEDIDSSTSIRSAKTVTASAWIAPNGKRYGKQTKRFPSGYLFTKKELRDMIESGIAEDLSGRFNPEDFNYEVIGFSWNETNGYKSGILIENLDTGELYVGNTADATVAKW